MGLRAKEYGLKSMLGLRLCHVHRSWRKLLGLGGQEFQHHRKVHKQSARSMTCQVGYGS